MSDKNRGRGGSRGGRGGGRGGGAAGGGGAGGEKPKREAILDLSRFVDKRIRVKFQGGREVTGLLKGYDQLLNLVLDDVLETVLDPSTREPLDPPQERALGLVVLRGPALTVINPVEGSEQIENPFLAAEG